MNAHISQLILQHYTLFVNKGLFWDPRKNILHEAENSIMSPELCKSNLQAIKFSFWLNGLYVFHFDMIFYFYFFSERTAEQIIYFQWQHNMLKVSQ